MQLSELKTALKRYGFDDSDPLTTWLNAAMHDLENAANWDWLYVRTTVVVAAGLGTFSLPSDGLRPVSIRNATAGMNKLEEWEVTRFEREVDDFTSTGTPRYYVVMNVHDPSGASPVAVDFWPLVSTQTTFRLVYQAVISDLVNDADTPSYMPKTLHYAIVQRAASIALQAENEEDRAQIAQGEFDASLARALAKLSATALDEPKAVVDVMGY